MFIKRILVYLHPNIIYMEKEEIYRIIKEEGDYFEFYSYNLKCYGRRNELLQTWSGYVEIPSIHGFKDPYSINVHGGITHHHLKSDGTLVIGFDCAHLNDLKPHFIKLIGDTGGTYRTKEYVRTEIESMAEQIHEYFPEYYNALVKVLTKINSR